ncbi:hypothetical protein EDD11_007038 [Mortierella claussenii]|nr:hypothetical protein EDD11_007038 [Mortierella claussenii]
MGLTNRSRPTERELKEEYDRLVKIRVAAMGPQQQKLERWRRWYRRSGDYGTDDGVEQVKDGPESQGQIQQDDDAESTVSFASSSALTSSASLTLDVELLHSGLHKDQGYHPVPNIKEAECMIVLDQDDPESLAHHERTGADKDMFDTGTVLPPLSTPDSASPAMAFLDVRSLSLANEELTSVSLDRLVVDLEGQVQWRDEIRERHEGVQQYARTIIVDEADPQAPWSNCTSIMSVSGPLEGSRFNANEIAEPGVSRSPWSLADIQRWVELLSTSEQDWELDQV